MADSLQLVIKSIFDASGVTAATNSINRIDAQINRVSRGVSKFMGLLAGGSALGGILALGSSAVKAYGESEAAASKLAKAMQNLNVFSDALLRDYQNQAAQLQRTTKYTDEQVMAVQAALTTYGLYGEKLKAATLATLNLATQTGDSAAAAKIVGKAYQGQTDTLGKMGIKISDTAVGAQKFDMVMAQLEKRFGGFAENEGKSFEGRLQIMTNRFDDLKEKLGKELMPVADTWLRWASTAMGALERLGSRETDNLKGIDLTIAGMKAKIAAETRYISEAIKAGETDDAMYKQAIANREQYLGILKKLQAQKAAAAAAQQAPVASRPTAAPEAELDNATASWLLNERNALMLAYYKRHINAQHKFNRDSTLTEQERARENKKVIRDIEQEWQDGSQTIAGGFEQAFMQMNSSAANWRDNWIAVVNGAVMPAKSAIHDFFTSTSAGFLDLQKLTKSVFDGILKSFLSMLEEMAAKAAIYGVFSMFGGGGLLGGSLGKFLSRDTGGPIPGREGAPTPILAHGGEFVLSANVVKAIKNGQPTSRLPMDGAASGGSGTTINYSPTININGDASGGNVDSMCRKIAEAARKGMASAVDLSKVTYKVGAKRSGETAL